MSFVTYWPEQEPMAGAPRMDDRTNRVLTSTVVDPLRNTSLQILGPGSDHVVQNECPQTKRPET